MYIGLSLSTCVRDIISGLMPESEVLYIIAGTRFESEEQFRDACVERYASTYWESDPMEGVGVAGRLYRQGRIWQPRVDGGPILNTASGNWLRVEQVHLLQSGDTLASTRRPEFYQS